MKNIFILITILSLFASCGKDDEKYPLIPEIKFESITPSTMTEFGSQISLTISYIDGDGDIGTSDPDIYSVSIKDARLNTPDYYHINPLTPPGETLQIEGELTFILPGIFVIGSGTQENTSFKVKLQDRAGNWSNEVTSSQISVTK